MKLNEEALEHAETLEEREIKGFKCLFLKGEIRFIQVLKPILSESDLEVLATIFQTAKIGELAEKRIRNSERREIVKHIEYLKNFVMCEEKKVINLIIDFLKGLVK